MIAGLSLVLAGERYTFAAIAVALQTAAVLLQNDAAVVAVYAAVFVRCMTLVPARKMYVLFNAYLRAQNVEYISCVYGLPPGAAAALYDYSGERWIADIETRHADELADEPGRFRELALGYAEKLAEKE